MSIVALQESWIPELSRFLLDGFPASLAPARDFGNPDLLRWKFFDPRGPWPGSRSLVVRENDRLLGHIGLCPTEFCSTDPNVKPVTTLLPTDWLASESASGSGGALLLMAFSRARTQYALGASPSATRVLVGVGFKEICVCPVFQKVLARSRLRCWRAIHGCQPWWRRMALLALDLAQSFRPRNLSGEKPVSAKRIEKFGPEVLQVIQRCKTPMTFTSRDPGLLNHYLRHPQKKISGWLLEQNGETRGFALLSIVQKPDARIGRIVECFLDSTDEEAWTAAITCLEKKLAEQGSEVISCFASTPWLNAGLRRNGFFRRGRVPFYLRDPRGQVRTDGFLHITQLEGDAAYN